MTRRLKFVGVLVVAIMAMSAVVASAASASNFGTESSPTFLKGEQGTKNIFTVTGGPVKCTTAVFTSKEITGTSVSSITVHPTYGAETGSGTCTAFGSAATVNTEGCNYVLTASSTTTGNVTIECETGKKIVVTVPTGSCTVSVGAQTPSTNMVGYTNEGSGATRQVTVKSEVEGITYTSSNESSICGVSGTNGTYTGTVITKGYGNAKFENQHGVFVE